MFLIRKILIGLLCVAVARGIVLAFGLDQRVAALIRIAMSPEWRQAVSWILSGIIGLIALALWETRPFWLRPPIKPDMRINDAIDYIVNDSIAKLKQPSPPRLMEYGPAKGRMMIQKGVEHEDTRRLLNTELASGNVRCWGRRQIINYLPLQFEDPVREIDQSYWNNMQLDFYAALYHTETVPQTAMISGRRPPAEFWTALTVSRSEIQRIWPRKSVFRRLFERATKHQRITALPN